MDKVNLGLNKVKQMAHKFSKELSLAIDYFCIWL